MKSAILYSFMILCLILCWSTSIYALSPNINTKRKTVNRISLSIFPVKDENTTSHPDCYNYYGKCVILGSDIPLLILENFDYSEFSDKKPGFIIYLNELNQLLLKQVSKELIGKKMAITLQQNILHIGKVKSVINSDSLQLTFCNRRNFYTISSVFSGGDLRTIRNLDCHCD